MNADASRLDAIQSMLAAGHRSLRLERHSLILWGLAGGALLLASNHILTADQFPAVQARAAAWLALLAVVLGLVGAVDWHLTRRVKRIRDRSWSFVHRQVIKVWWLMMGLGALLTFAMFFYGGGTMLCAAWIVLVGIALYVHGLFSERLLEGVGGMAVAIGVALLAARVGYEVTRLAAAAVFGLGLPLLAVMLDRDRARTPLLAAVWLLCVLLPPLAAARWDMAGSPPAGPVVPLAGAVTGGLPAGPAIVAMPAGTVIPVRLTLSGNLFTADSVAEFPLVLARPLDVVFQDGKPTALFRPEGQGWTTAPGALAVMIPKLDPVFVPGAGPMVVGRVQVLVSPPSGR